MKNRAVTLLALLDANDRLGQPEIYRTVLMKQAFLAETIRPLHRQWHRTFAFVRYHYGPYSEDVFHRLDILVFHGLVEVAKFRRTRERLAARYRITPAGRAILKQIDAQELSALATDIVWALQALGVDQAGTIAKLVYQEAEFARIFAEHEKAGIRADTKFPLPAVTAANNETFVALATLEALCERQSKDRAGGSRFALPARQVVRIFLEYLAMQVPRMLEDERTA